MVSQSHLLYRICNKILLCREKRVQSQLGFRPLNFFNIIWAKFVPRMHFYLFKHSIKESKTYQKLKEESSTLFLVPLGGPSESYYKCLEYIKEKNRNTE